MALAGRQGSAGADLPDEVRQGGEIVSAFDRLLRMAAVAVGLALMALGLVGALLPTHLLGAFLVLGLILVLRNSHAARRRFVRLQRRHPRYLYPLRRLLRREPEVWPVLWHELLPAERMLPHRFRLLRRCRLAFRRR